MTDLPTQRDVFRMRMRQRDCAHANTVSEWTHLAKETRLEMRCITCGRVTQDVTITDDEPYYPAAWRR